MPALAQSREIAPVGGYGKLVQQPSLVLAIYRLPGKNTVAIANRIKTRLRGITHELPSSITLGILFGNTIPALGLAHDDGAELPSFTSDNVGYNAAVKHTLADFPFVGTPH